MKNNYGFSLIQVMISVSMLAAVSLGFLKLSENQTKLQRTSQDSQSLMENITFIRNVINNSKYCGSTLASSSSSDLSGDLEEFPLSVDPNFQLNSATNLYESITDLAQTVDSTFQIRSARGRSIFEESIYQWKKTEVDDLDPSSRKHPWVMTGAELKVVSSTSTFSGEANAFLALNFMRTTDKAKLSGNTRRKEFPLQVSIKRDGAVLELKRCFSDQDGAIVTACESMGGVFDPDSTPQCQLSAETIELIVASGLTNMPKTQMYYDQQGEITTKSSSLNVSERTCANCGSGCNPCHYGEVEIEKSCSTDGLCGVPNRWRNCKAKCGKETANTIAGYLYNEGVSSTNKVHEVTVEGYGQWAVPENLVGGRITVHLLGSGSGGGWSGAHKGGGRGHPGTVKIVEIEVIPGLQCSYVVGKGGRGGQHQQDIDGELGKQSTFVCNGGEAISAAGAAERSCSNCKGDSVGNASGDTGFNVTFDGKIYKGGVGGKKMAMTK